MRRVDGNCPSSFLIFVVTMPLVENAQQLADLQRNHTRSLSSQEKQLQSASMNLSLWLMVQRQLRSENASLGERELKIAVARRMYWNRPNTLALLDFAEHDTSR